MFFHAMGATIGAGNTYPSGALELTPVFSWDTCCLIFSMYLCSVLCVNVCPFVLFLSTIALYCCPSSIFYF